MGRAPWSERTSRDKIWLLAGESGESKVLDFINDLDHRTLAETAELFDRTETHGPPRNIEKFRHLGDDVFEFKVHRARAVRYLTLRCKDGWLVAIAENKKKSNAFQTDIKRAHKISDEIGGC